MSISGMIKVHNWSVSGGETSRLIEDPSRSVSPNVYNVQSESDFERSYK